MRDYQRAGTPIMNKFTNIVFIALFFYVPTLLLCQEKQSLDRLIDQINNLYDSIEDNEEWAQQTNALTDLLLLFFQDTESLTYDIETIFPFIRPVSSEDSVVAMYSWFKKNGGTASFFDAILQYKLNGKVLVKPMRHNVEYYEVFPLKDNTYLFHGSTDTGFYSVWDDFTAVEINDNHILPYNAFYGTDSLSFSCLIASPFEDIDYLPRIIDVSYNFDNVPFTIKLTYAKSKNPVDKTKEIENTILIKEFEFIFNGREFFGDYSLFDRDFVLDENDALVLSEVSNQDNQQNSNEQNMTIPDIQSDRIEQEEITNNSVLLEANSDITFRWPFVPIFSGMAIIAVGIFVTIIFVRKKRDS
jgi:hypothetical protein